MLYIKLKKTALYLIIILLFTGNIVNAEEKYRSISSNVLFAKIASDRLYFVPIVVPLFFYICLLLLRKKLEGDNKPKKILTQEDPPEGISPAMTNYLYFDKADPSFLSRFIYIFSSTVVDMAVRGVINLEIINKKDILGITRGDNRFSSEFYNEYAELIINYTKDQNRINLSKEEIKPEEKNANKNKPISKYLLIQELKKNIKKNSEMFYKQPENREKIPVYLLVYIPIAIFYL